MSAPRFYIGDRVCDLDGERLGVVLSIGPVDECAGRRYLVAEVYVDGRAKWRNESNLRHAAAVTDYGSPIEGWS